MHHSVHHEPLWILAVSAAIAVIGIFVGYVLSRPSTVLSKAGLGATLADVGRNRLYIDWFFQRTIVAPLEWLAGLSGWFDRTVVDGAIQFISGVPRLAGMLGQRTQTGRIPTYSYLTAIGIAAVAIWVVTRTNW